MMTLRFLLFVCMVFFASLSVPPGEAAGADTFATETEGIGVMTGGDIAGAQADALHSALVRAVEEAIASVFPMPFPSEQRKRLATVVDKAESFIETYKIAGETREQNELSVRVSAVVYLPTLRDELERAGLIQKKESTERRIVAVTVRGFGNYNDYASFRDLLQAEGTGIDSVLARRMEWSAVQWDVGIRGTAEDVVKELERTGRLSFHVKRAGPEFVELQIIP